MTWRLKRRNYKIMRMMFFGDGVWATDSLRRLIREGWQVIGVVARTNPTDRELLVVAENENLPIFQPNKVNADCFISKVAELNPEVNISVSYDQILRGRILGVAPLGFINFHAGNLPRYRGRNVINWAIINGESELGITAHYVDEGIDTGDIILQKTLGIKWTDTYADVLGKVIAAIPDVVMHTMRLIASGKVKRKRQDHNLATYFPKRRDGDEWLDWCDSSVNIYNKIRAISSPGPGSRTFLDKAIVTIWRAYYDWSWPKYVATPGEVVGICEGEGVKVKTGDSTLLVQEVQVGGNESHIPIWPIGTRLGINWPSLIPELRVNLLQLKRLLNADGKLK